MHWDILNKSFCLLRRIAGLNERKAKEIIAWRERNGSFRSREQLKEVRCIGEKTFQQCAGFVRIFQHSPEAIVIDTDEEGDKSSKGKFSGKRKADGCGPSTSKKRKHTPSLIVFDKLDSTSIHPESYATTRKWVCRIESFAWLLDRGKTLGIWSHRITPIRRASGWILPEAL